MFEEAFRLSHKQDHVITQGFCNKCIKNHQLEMANLTVKPKAQFKVWKT